MKYCSICETEIGALTLVCDKDGLKSIEFGRTRPEGALWESNGLLEEAKRELLEYLEGNRREFSLPLKPEGTEFQKRVWKALTAIPYGETRTYGQIAAQIGNPKACRAVGMANHKNPLPIMIPCHRVIGTGGSLVGYGGGLDRKIWLLKLENPGKIIKNF